MGKILVTVDASKEFVLNVLTQNNIKATDFTFGEYPRFFISYRERKRVIDVFSRHGKTVTVLSDRSFPTFFKKNILRVGIFSALVLSIVFAYFYSLKVTDIVVSGNKSVPIETIEKAICDNCAMPAVKKDVDTDRIEKEVTKLDGVSSTSVYIKGKTLFCTVLEELPKVDVVDKSDYTPVTSLYDAIVTRIVVFDGKAAVKKGDAVRKGQTLISETVVIDEEKGLFVQTKPLGEVYGRVWVTETQIFHPTVVRRVRTGRSRTTVRFFNDEFAPDVEFAAYEREVQERTMDAVFPLKIYVATDYEVEEREEGFDFDANADAVIKSATQSLEDRLPEGCEKVRTWFEIKRLDKTVRLDIYYEIEIKIS